MLHPRVGILFAILGLSFAISDLIFAQGGMDRTTALRIIASTRPQCTWTESGVAHFDHAESGNVIVPYRGLTAELLKSFGSTQLTVVGEFDPPYHDGCILISSSYEQNRETFDRIMAALVSLGVRCKSDCESASRPVPQQVPAASNAANKSSFDCANAKTASARLICADGELSRLDAQLASPFRKKLAQLTGPERDTFIREQREWISKRNSTCGLKGKDNEPIDSLKSAQGCMAQWIRNRTAEISKANSTSAPKIASASDSWVVPQPTSWDVACNEKLEENQNIRIMAIVAYIKDSDREIFLDNAKITRFLDQLIEPTRKRCAVQYATWERDYNQPGVDYSLPNAYNVFVDLQQIAFSRTSFSAYRLPGSNNWIIRQNLTAQSVLQDRQELKKIQDAELARRQEAEQAELTRQAAIRAVENGLAQARTDAQTPAADGEFVSPVISVLRNRRQAGTSLACADNYEFVGGRVADRSIDGTVGVFLVQVNVVNKSTGLVGGKSWFADVCGSVGHDLAPGQRGTLTVKAVFRKYDSGWRYENLQIN